MTNEELLNQVREIDYHTHLLEKVLQEKLQPFLEMIPFLTPSPSPSPFQNSTESVEAMLNLKEVLRYQINNNALTSYPDLADLTSFTKLHYPTFPYQPNVFIKNNIIIIQYYMKYVNPSSSHISTPVLILHHDNNQLTVIKAIDFKPEYINDIVKTGEQFLTDRYNNLLRTAQERESTMSSLIDDIDVKKHKLNQL